MSDVFGDISRESFHTMTSKDLLGFICGEHLGSGAYREVFVYRPDPSCVIKIEQGAGAFANVREWELWNGVRHSKETAQWLAPCIDISPCGIFLLMKRTRPLRKEDKLPLQLPEFMTDIQCKNFGVIGKKIVCHDYANNLCYNYALGTKMKRVHFDDWRGSDVLE